MAISRERAAFRVWRDARGRLRADVRGEPTLGEIEAGTLKLISMLESDAEHLIVNFYEESRFDIANARVWSRLLAPHRSRFSVTDLVGVRSRFVRMTISSVAFVDRQVVRFFDSLGELEPV